MDEIFKALNDPARRALLDALRRQDGQSLTDLEAVLPQLSRFGVMKHMKILEEAGLVLSKKSGRFKYHYLNALPMQEVLDRWIDPFRAKPVARSMLNLKHQLEGTNTMSQTPKGPKPDFMMQTFIKTSVDALWDALTQAEHIAAYHFAASNAEQREDGGHNVLRIDGSNMLSMSILSLDPKSRLEFQFQPHWKDADVGPSRCVFLIAEEDHCCKLTCEHYDIPAGQEAIHEGWARQIASLKSYLETGVALKAPFA